MIRNGGGGSARPGTASTTNSIVNMLIIKKKQAVGASHMLVKDLPQTAREYDVAKKAQNVTVKNIMKRNRRLPVDLVEKYVGIEMRNA